MNKMEDIIKVYYAVRKWYPDPDNGITIIVDENYFDSRDKAEEELRKCKETVKQYKGKWHPHYRCTLDIYRNAIILGAVRRLIK